MFEAFSLSMLGAFSPSLLPVKACKKHQWGGGGGLPHPTNTPPPPPGGGAPPPPPIPFSLEMRYFY